jgi:hypothetical protein
VEKEEEEKEEVMMNNKRAHLHCRPFFIQEAIAVKYAVRPFQF